MEAVSPSRHPENRESRLTFLPDMASSTYECTPYSGPSFMPSNDMRPGPDT
jgi:hypothetical protein